jgi:hypothetical protein
LGDYSSALIRLDGKQVEYVDMLEGQYRPRWKVLGFRP